MKYNILLFKEDGKKEKKKKKKKEMEHCFDFIITFFFFFPFISYTYYLIFENMTLQTSWPIDLTDLL